MKGLMIVTVILGTLLLGAIYMAMRPLWEEEPIDPRWDRVIEVKRIVGLSGVPPAVWPKPENLHDKQAPFVFFQVETNGGAHGFTDWIVRVEGEKIEHFGGQDSWRIEGVVGKTLFLQKVNLGVPGGTFPCAPYRGLLSIKSISSGGTKQFHARAVYQGDCEKGIYEFVEGAVAYDPHATYWVCNRLECYPIREGKTGPPEEIP